LFFKPTPHGFLALISRRLMTPVQLIAVQASRWAAECLWNPLPGDEAPGYYHVFLWDKEGSGGH
jgi:hypothetical protein